MLALLDGYSEQNKARIVAFGSSIVERRHEGMHWFDCLELAIRWNVGRVGHFINCGHDADTTRELLARLDRDVSPFRPDITVIAIGGNDTKPELGITESEFRENLESIIDRLQVFGSEIVLLTYNSPDVRLFEPDRFVHFSVNMQIIRDITVRKGAHLVDNFKLWEALRKSYPEKHQSLMQDHIHVNALGNLVMGLNLMEHFGQNVGGRDPAYWRAALEVFELAKTLEADTSILAT